MNDYVAGRHGKVLDRETEALGELVVTARGSAAVEACLACLNRVHRKAPDLFNPGGRALRQRAPRDAGLRA